MKLFSLACLLLVLGSALSSDGRDWRPQMPEHISLLQLIATPERYDGKLVAVTGFLHLEFEEDILYLHEEDYRERISKNGVWVERNALLKDLRSGLDLHYVSVVGVFDSANKGHMSSASGTLTNITKAFVWPPVIVPLQR